MEIRLSYRSFARSLACQTRRDLFPSQSRGAALKGRISLTRSPQEAMSRETPAPREDDMAAATVFTAPTRTDIRFHDRVRVPDGHTGKVVGFYRTKTEMALVQLDDGERRKFVLSELELAVHG
jgi:hypothetical protein